MISLETTYWGSSQVYEINHIVGTLVKDFITPIFYQMMLRVLSGYSLEHTKFKILDIQAVENTGEPINNFLSLFGLAG